MKQKQRSRAPSARGGWHRNRPTSRQIKEAQALGEEVLVEVASVDDANAAWALVTSLDEHELRSAV